MKNLSQRLDEARAARERVRSSEEELGVFELRIRREGGVYNGTDFRSGQPMTEERWRELQDQQEAARRRLPAWNPRRAHEEHRAGWQAQPPDPQGEPSDTPADASDAGSGDDHEADVIAFRQDVFEMPAWARDERVYTPLTTDAPAAGTDTSGSDQPTCSACGAAANVVHLDLLADEARLECPRCGLRWTDRGRVHAPRGR